MIRKILLFLGLESPTLKEIREKYKFPYEPMVKRSQPIGIFRHIERIK